MKRKSFLIFLLLILFVNFFPISIFTEWDPQKTVAVYFFNQYGQFMPKDVDALGIEVATYLNKNNIFVWYLGMTSENIAIEKIKKLSKVYVILEYSANIITVSGNKGDYKITIEMKLKGKNLKNNDKNFETSITNEGSSMPDLSNARAIALQQTGVKITDKNIDKVKKLFDSEK